MILHVPNLRASASISGYFFHDQPWVFDRLVLTEDDDNDNPAFTYDNNPQDVGYVCGPPNDLRIESLVVCGLDLMHKSEGMQVSRLVSPGKTLDEIGNAWIGRVCQDNAHMRDMFNRMRSWIFSQDARVMFRIRNRGTIDAGFKLRLVRREIDANVLHTRSKRNSYHF